MQQYPSLYPSSTKKASSYPSATVNSKSRATCSPTRATHQTTSPSDSHSSSPVRTTYSPASIAKVSSAHRQYCRLLCRTAMQTLLPIYYVSSGDTP